MKNLIRIMMIISLLVSSAVAQDFNKVVFGPLEGDSAGVLTVHSGEDIEIEMWIHVDPENPGCILGMAHGLMTEDAIIAERNGAVVDPYYDEPHWVSVWVDGPFINNPDDYYPIPEGHTVEMLVAIASIFGCDSVLHILPDTGWVYYASFLMVCNDNVPIGETYNPFSMGWYPHSGQATRWYYGNPPGGSVVPEQSYCGLYFEPVTNIDENENLPLEFSLAQNYPNPFNATTTIKYSLPEESEVTIEIYNILGRKVETLISGIQPTGWHSAVWDAENQPSGVYFYRLEAVDYVETSSCLLLK